MVYELYDSAGMILYELCWFFANILTKPQCITNLGEVLRKKATYTCVDDMKLKLYFEILQNMDRVTIASLKKKKLGTISCLVHFMW